MAVTEGARERLEVLREEDAEASVARESVANVEIVRLQRDEVGSRIVPLAGVYAEASAVVRLPCAWQLCGVSQAHRPGLCGTRMMPRWQGCRLSSRSSKSAYMREARGFEH